MSPSDSELLQRYAQTRSETAFADLVARHLDLVYSAALRQVRRPHLAQEVTQHVFLDLARQASRLGPDQVLGAWLYTVTRRRAIDLIRRETRRQAHERASVDLAPDSDHPEPDWARVAPLLDEAMQTLPAPERSAVLLRYFENKSLRDVGAVLGVSDDAAQKRVQRALDRLRAHFARRRLSLDAAGLAALLAGLAVQAAPAGLAAPLAASALANATATGLATLFPVLTMSAFSKTLVVAGLALGLGFGLYEHSQAAGLRHELADLRARQEASDRAQAERLSALAAENTRLRASSHPAPVETPPAENADDSTIAAIAAWLERLQVLRSRFENQPESAIPEMSLLTETDWLNASKNTLSDEEDFRRACAFIRDQAEYRLGLQAQAAMRKYAAARNGQLPTTTAELAPWFDSSVTPAMLARWVFLPADDPVVASVKVGSDRVFTQVRLIDPDFDLRRVFSSHSFNSISPIHENEPLSIKSVRAAYAAAHAGRDATDLPELLPYAATSEAQTVLRYLIKQEAELRAAASAKTSSSR